jgi:hypothetical protein
MPNLFFDKNNHYNYEIPETDLVVMKLQDLEECRRRNDFYPQAPSYNHRIDNDHVVLFRENYNALVDYYPGENEIVVLNMPDKEVYAEARISLDPNEPWIIVYSGVRVGEVVPSMKSPARKKRRDLESTGVIVEGVLQRNQTFENYSLAAEVISGCSINGNDYWKQEGESLTEIGIGIVR